MLIKMCQHVVDFVNNNISVPIFATKNSKTKTVCTNKSHYCTAEPYYLGKLRDLRKWIAIIHW